MKHHIIYTLKNIKQAYEHICDQACKINYVSTNYTELYFD